MTGRRSVAFAPSAGRAYYVSANPPCHPPTRGRRFGLRRLRALHSTSRSRSIGRFAGLAQRAKTCTPGAYTTVFVSIDDCGAHRHYVQAISKFHWRARGVYKCATTGHMWCVCMCACACACADSMTREERLCGGCSRACVSGKERTRTCGGGGGGSTKQGLCAIRCE
ncbi:hypothetical protein DAEQUDRAFT_77144 [Daedalea quercina L-15889]|uniref:Uncharacterized protein n=1 Tax=Daedalea quercina L-15889 TaxID=1314783 RepID=A0A165SF34_9APHY|nr:hypothetical protein DAEQUDRAFT_77144 [Daedalea quercina L-15889]